MNKLFGDKIHEDCGIFGIYAPGEDVARLTYFGLLALQHRGQDSAGITVSDGNKLQTFKNIGLVTEVFSEDNLDLLKGNLAIGHVRYSQFEGLLPVNSQPVVSSLGSGQRLVYNGKLTNSFELKECLRAFGSNLETTRGAETLKKSLNKLKGTYSMVVSSDEQLIGIRDPHGVRPLCLGKLGEGYVLASESCAFDIIRAKFIRDVRPGEMLIIDHNGLRSMQILERCQHNLCSLEYIYFARQDSIMENSLIYSVRQALGNQLARECPVNTDMVIPVPDSGIASASGYAKQLGLPLKEGLVKNRYVGRTLIQSHESLRERTVRLKYNPVKDILKDQRVVLIDDSIVSGNTTRHIVKQLRAIGVKEVNMLISSPPLLYPCYYGIDMISSNKLIASQFNLVEIKKYLGVDRLHYLSLEGLLEALKPFHSSVCKACFNGDYPIEIPDLFYKKETKL